jgi:hypothetical protein
VRPASIGPIGALAWALRLCAEFSSRPQRQAASALRAEREPQASKVSARLEACAQALSSRVRLFSRFPGYRRAFSVLEQDVSSRAFM